MPSESADELLTALLGQDGTLEPLKRVLIERTQGNPFSGGSRSPAPSPGSARLYETSHFPDLEYMFKHALTHEVAYASMLHDRRRALHARIVEALEVLYPDRLTEQVQRRH